MLILLFVSSSNNGFTTIANPKVQQLPKCIDYFPNNTMYARKNLPLTRIKECEMSRQMQNFMLKVLKNYVL
jgi:hypothetical protein